ncbi:HAMP domain-containing sensor histidine kinase [Spirochaeta dissipatitropha]
MLKSANPISRIFILIGATTMILVIFAGIWSNTIYERQYLRAHRISLQENAELIASILERIPEEERSTALLIVRDLIASWDRHASYRHRVSVSDLEGSELLIFPYNIGILAYSAESSYSSGYVTLHTSAPSPDYPSQLTVLAVLGLIIVAIIGIGMLTAGKALQQPLHALATAAEHFAEGNLDYRTSPDTHPVVAEVAITMNQMAGQLKSRIATITQQRQELEALFSSMIEGIIVLDTSGNVRRMNHVAAGFFSADPEGDTGKALLQVVRNTAVAALVEEATNSTEVIQREIRVFGQDISAAEGRILQIHAARYSSGSKSRILLVMHDISDIRRLETIRRDFVSNVSHELKTPITTISGFIETILDDKDLPEEQMRRFLTIIQNQSFRLQAIIEDLLSLSRIEEYGRELPRSCMQVKELLKNVVHLCEHDAAVKDIQISLSHSEPDTVEANSNLIEQALFNLVQNAIKYSPPKSRVEIHAYSSDPDEQQADTDSEGVWFRVADTGAGIPQQDLPRLFERFYRVDRARSREQGGTGLGLAIVRHIALAHDGRTAVKSTLGKGSEFSIFIPKNPKTLSAT